MTYPYEWTVLDWDEKHKITKESKDPNAYQFKFLRVYTEWSQHLSLGGLFMQNRTFICSKDLLERFILLTLHLKKKMKYD